MELMTYGNYEQYKQELDTELRKTTEGFVKIGYLLKVAKDTDILRESGYANVYDFAQAEYNIDKSQVSRFMHINDRFSEGGYSERLKEEYRGFGHAKLTIMLQLPDEINEELTPDFTKSEIQALKEEMDEENKISAIEVLMEEKDPLLKQEENNLYKVLYQLGKEDSELYESLHAASGGGIKAVHEVFAPDGEKIYSVRIMGVGRLMLSVKDPDRPVTVTNMRTAEKEEYAWEEMLRIVSLLMAAGMSAEASWESVYGEKFPKKEQVAPVQPPAQQKKDPPKKETPKKETKVQKARKPESKKAVPEKEETAKEPEKPIPGQDSVLNHPEYMPKSPEILNENGNLEDAGEKTVENVTETSEIVEKTPLEESEKPINTTWEADSEEPAAGSEESAEIITRYKDGIESGIKRLEMLAQEERWGSIATVAADIKWQAEQINRIMARS